MIGAFLYTNYDVDLYKSYDLFQEDSIIEEGERVRNQVLAFPRLNVLKEGFQNIIESKQWQTMWQQKWKDRSSSTCIIMCGPYSPYLGVHEQETETSINE